MASTTSPTLTSPPLMVQGVPLLNGSGPSNVGSEVPVTSASKAERECGNAETHRLTPTQLNALAKKVYALLLDELRIEAERYGRVYVR